MVILPVIFMQFPLSNGLAHPKNNISIACSPEKQSELKTFEKAKSPVRIQNYNSKPGLNGKEETIIQKFTMFAALDSDDVNFKHNRLLTVYWFQTSHPLRRLLWSKYL
jgi:hypothetical protein